MRFILIFISFHKKHARHPEKQYTKHKTWVTHCTQIPCISRNSFSLNIISSIVHQHKQHFPMLYVQTSRTQSMIVLLLQNGWPATE